MIAAMLRSAIMELHFHPNVRARDPYAHALKSAHYRANKAD